VLYDAVLAVRRERPQLIVSTFVGGVSDGHGHHQVSGEIAQEAFKAAADPTVFPDQLKDGLQPWQPLAVYSMVPFAPITEKGIFDYATGKWAPARFKNYVTGEWTEGALSADVTLPVGNLDPVLGRSSVQIARQGWGEQKSQNGGANPALSGPATTSYHLWAVAPEAAAKPGTTTKNDDLFHNSKVAIETSIAGLDVLVKGQAPQWLSDGLTQIDANLKQFDTSSCQGTTSVVPQTQHKEDRALAPEDDFSSNREINLARKLAPIYKQALNLREKLVVSNLDAEAKPACSSNWTPRSMSFNPRSRNCSAWT
jgi:hypothetical protein